MEKTLLFPALLAVGCVISGLYGALHNQISYTVSPDYFHAFKFDQFGIPEDLQNRFGAAIVGWRASWWMGLIIGVPVLLIGLIMPGWKAYLTRCLLAFGVIAATTLLVGLGALLYASLTITDELMPPSIFHQGVDAVSFARAGAMHNSSYLGGLIGIVTGSVYLVLERLRSG